MIVCSGTIKNENIDLMTLVERMHFLQDGFQMTAIVLVLVINLLYSGSYHVTSGIAEV